MKNDITNQLFYGSKKTFTSKDMEREFYRRLLINSNHILRRKGTKNGIEMMMNMFGIDRDKWSLTEYIYIAEDTICDTDVEEIENINITTPSTLNGVVYSQTGNETESTDIEEIQYSDKLNNITLEREYLDTYRTCPNCAKPVLNGFLLPYMIGKTEHREYIVYSQDKRFGIKYFNGTENIIRYDKCNENIFNSVDGYTDYVIVDENGTEIENNFLVKVTQLYDGGEGTILIDGYENTFKRICPLCNGSGEIRDFIGVPYFKGNSERLYYQQNGGWWRETLKYLNSTTDITTLLEINGSLLKLGDLYFVDDVSSLIKSILPNTNEIIPEYKYVVHSVTGDGTINYGIGDISYSHGDSFFGQINQQSFSRPYGSDAIVIYHPTNYFVLTDMTMYNTLDGWENIPETRFSLFTSEKNSDITVSVDKINSIIDIVEGNNVHVGYGKFDKGVNYVQHFAKNRESILGVYIPSGGISEGEEYVVYSKSGDGTIIYNGETMINGTRFAGVSNITTYTVDGDARVHLNNHLFNMTGETSLFKYILDNAPDCIKRKDNNDEFVHKQYKDLFDKGFVVREVIDTKKVWYTDKDGILQTNDNYELRPNKWLYEDFETNDNGELIITFEQGNNTRMVKYNIL